MYVICLHFSIFYHILSYFFYKISKIVSPATFVNNSDRVLTLYRNSDEHQQHLRMQSIKNMF